MPRKCWLSTMLSVRRKSQEQLTVNLILSLLLPEAKFKEMIICNRRLERGFLLFPLKKSVSEVCGWLQDFWQAVQCCIVESVSGRSVHTNAKFRASELGRFLEEINSCLRTTAEVKSHKPGKQPHNHSNRWSVAKQISRSDSHSTCSRPTDNRVALSGSKLGHPCLLWGRLTASISWAKS